MSKSGSRGRSSGGNGKVKEMAMMPAETVAKLNTVLSGIIDRPQPPSRPDVVRLDELQRELDQAKQLEDPVARMAAVTRGYDNWRRGYDRYLGTVNPIPTINFIPPPSLSSTPVTTTPASSRTASPTPKIEEKTEIKTEDEDEEEEEEEMSEVEEPAVEEEPEPAVRTATFDCPQCEKTFASQGALTRHVRQAHELWMGKASTPLGLKRLKTEPEPGDQTGKGIVFYPASSRR